MALQHSSRLNITQKMGDSTAARTPRQVGGTDHPVDWVGFAQNLGNLLRREFLSAVDFLLSLSSLSSLEFRSHSRKIAALIELAQRTLANAGVQAYEFSYCPPSLVSYKVAYIKLLHLLKDRRNDLEPSLQDRTRRLLGPLSPSFRIHRRGEAGSLPSHWPQGNVHNPKAPNASLWPAPSTSQTATQRRPTMPPPPPAMPAGSRKVISSIDGGGSPRRLWTTDEGLSFFKGVSMGETSVRPLKRRRLPGPHRKMDLITDPSADQENAASQPLALTSANLPGAISYRIIRPMPRRFGIFCTGKTSMHGSNPRAWRSRPIAVRPIE